MIKYVTWNTNHCIEISLKFLKEENHYKSKYIIIIFESMNKTLYTSLFSIMKHLEYHFYCYLSESSHPNLMNI